MDPLDDAYTAWFREALATSTYVYDCYANPLCGFDCTMFTGRGTTVDFPTTEIGPPD